MPDPREPDISREDDPLTIMFGADRAEIDALTAQRDEAVRALRRMADGLGVDWVDHPVLSQEWADAIPITGDRPNKP